MEVIYGLLPGMLILGVIGVAVFIWAVKSGQYYDLDGAAHRVLLDEENDDTDQNDEQEKLK